MEKKERGVVTMKKKNLYLVDAQSENDVKEGGKVNVNYQRWIIG